MGVTREETDPSIGSLTGQQAPADPPLGGWQSGETGGVPAANHASALPVPQYHQQQLITPGAPTPLVTPDCQPMQIAGGAGGMSGGLGISAPMSMQTVPTVPLSGSVAPPESGAGDAAAPPPTDSVQNQLVRELEEWSGAERRLFDEVNGMRQLLARNNELTAHHHAALSSSLSLVGPLQQDLASRGTVAMRLLQDLEDREAEAGVLRADIAKLNEDVGALRHENSELQQKLGRLPPPEDAAVLAAELAALPRPALEERAAALNSAAKAAVGEARAAKEALVAANEEVLRNRDRQHSVAVLRQSLQDQSQFILQLQEELKESRARYKQCREAAEAQEAVIERLEQLLRDRTEPQPQNGPIPNGASNGNGNGNGIDATLKLKLASLQRQQQDWFRERGELLSRIQRGDSAETARLRDEEAKLNDEIKALRQELASAQARERDAVDKHEQEVISQKELEKQQQQAAARIQAVQRGRIGRRKFEDKRTFEEKYADAQGQIERYQEQLSAAQAEIEQLQAEKGKGSGGSSNSTLSPRSLMRLRTDAEHAKVRAQVLEETMLNRERTYGREIAGLRAQLAEARAVAMASKPVTPPPAPLPPQPVPALPTQSAPLPPIPAPASSGLYGPPVPGSGLVPEGPAAGTQGYVRHEAARIDAEGVQTAGPAAPPPQPITATQIGDIPPPPAVSPIHQNNATASPIQTPQSPQPDALPAHSATDPHPTSVPWTGGYSGETRPPQPAQGRVPPRRPPQRSASALQPSDTTAKKLEPLRIVPRHRFQTP